MIHKPEARKKLENIFQKARTNIRISNVFLQSGKNKWNSWLSEFKAVLNKRDIDKAGKAVQFEDVTGFLWMESCENLQSSSNIK